ncbi:hypothetical protein C7458_101545 [Williamsia muralis]|nr:hypothetical protein C7458_101545 [Williamsia marianensis]
MGAIERKSRQSRTVCPATTRQSVGIIFLREAPTSVFQARLRQSGGGNSDFCVFGLDRGGRSAGDLGRTAFVGSV